MSLDSQIEDRIGIYERAMSEALEKWDSVAVRINSKLGGVDPDQVKGALRSIDERAKRWKERGRALAYGRPLQLGTGKADTLPQWVDLGNVLTHETASTGDMAVESRIDTVIADTVKETAVDVGKVAEAAKAQLTWWAPFIIPAVIVVGIIGAIAYAATWAGALRKAAP